MLEKLDTRIRLVQIVTLLFVGFFCCLFVHPVFAQESTMAMTITPPLFQMTVTPGIDWQSAIKVTNNNTYEITVYASVLNFEAEGEGGGSRFLPIITENPETVGRLLSDWIIVSPQPIAIPAGKSVQVPYIIRTPDDAEPGGHYAAIMIGTRPVMKEDEGPSMKISSLIASLIFARVEGDIVEKGRIREFSTEKSFYQEPTATFSLRFENVGNVHMIPRGDIIIYNMWGKERGRIKINEKVGYGAVLPGVIRNFKFEWESEAGSFEIGRYRAIATIVYGEEERQSENYQTYFWVVPMRPVLSILGFLAIFIGFIYWSIRKYIRNALEMERQYTEDYAHKMGWGHNQRAMGKKQPMAQPTLKKQQQRVVYQPAPRMVKQPQRVVTQPKKPELSTLARPIIRGAVDLRNVSSKMVANPKNNESSMTLGEFLKTYKTFFMFLIIIGVCSILIWQFFDEVLVKERDYQVQEIIEEGTGF